MTAVTWEQRAEDLTISDPPDDRGPIVGVPQQDLDALEMVEDDTKPQRAFSIVVTAGADTAQELAWALRNLADRVERGDVTTGCSGGPSSGYLYSYRERPVTHDEYFAAIDRALTKRSNE